MYIFLVHCSFIIPFRPLDFIPKNIQRYAESHTELPSDLLQQIDRDTYLNVLRPRMLSGHMQGRILSMLSYMIRPDCILEVGTYTGYSALCLAEGMSKEGKLITIDSNEELETLVQGYFDQSPFRTQIEYKIGNALNVIPTLDHSFDMVFIDADKSNYQNYYDMLIPKMRKGGFIVADNILWSGKVVEEVKKGDKDTLAIQAFNKFVHEDQRVENVLMAVRDGLMILRVR